MENNRIEVFFRDIALKLKKRLLYKVPRNTIVVENIAADIYGSTPGKGRMRSPLQPQLKLTLSG
ncbi:hypothetical protein [Xenorhabdus sp. SGI240]|uniref:hypothetical protein n=1 Tax=Xenorhabdus sp. SGI240 TaxID=3158262 RepID=UPI0032B7BB97